MAIDHRRHHVARPGRQFPGLGGRDPSPVIARILEPPPGSATRVFTLAGRPVGGLQRGLAPWARYDELPPGLLEKFRSLDGFEFQNPDSQESLAYWKGRQGDIEDLYEFYAQYANKFIGGNDCWNACYNQACRRDS